MKFSRKMLNQREFWARKETPSKWKSRTTKTTCLFPRKTHLTARNPVLKSPSSAMARLSTPSTTPPKASKNKKKQSAKPTKSNYRTVWTAGKSETSKPLSSVIEIRTLGSPVRSLNQEPKPGRPTITMLQLRLQNTCQISLRASRPAKQCTN